MVFKSVCSWLVTPLNYIVLDVIEWISDDYFSEYKPESCADFKTVGVTVGTRVVCEDPYQEGCLTIVGPTDTNRIINFATTQK